MAVTRPTSPSLVAETLLNATPTAVFDLWTSDQGIRSWWVDRSRIELRVLGPFELYFLDDQPVGQQGSDGCVVLSWLPAKMLSFTWNAPPEFGELRGQYTQVVLEFDAVGDRTHLRLTHHGWPEQLEGRWQELFAYFEAVWPRVLDALETHLAR